MKQLVISFIIVILSYYPVHALNLSQRESIEVISKGRILKSNGDVGSLTAWVLYEDQLHWCFAKTKWMPFEDYHDTNSAFINCKCTQTVPID